MKIAYIAGWPIPSCAANSVHVMKMCQAFANNNHDVMLLCPKGELKNAGDVFEQYGVKKNFNFVPIQMRKGRLGLIFYALNTAYRARKFNAHYIHSRCLMSAWIATYFGLNVSFEKHDSMDEQGILAKTVFQMLIKRKNFLKLIVISDALKEHLSTRFSISPEKITVAHDGADPMPEASKTPPFYKTQNTLHIGYVGHLYKGRGIDIIASVAKTMTDAQFHIVGGTPEDLEYWKTTLSDIQNIHFYGHVPHSKTVEFLKHFDILLAPYQKKVSIHGGAGNTVQWMSPLKVFEYMATGIPTICSDLPVLHEILEDKRNVFLCTPDNSQDWITTIQYIKDHPTEAQYIAKAAQSEFLSKYTWQKRAEFIIEKL